MARRRQLPAHLPEGQRSIDTGTVELEGDPDRPGGVMVYVNGVESSYVDLDDPRHLEFEYMQQMLLAMEDVLADPAPRILHLGGAACAFARTIHALQPQARQLVVELDGALARFAREWFDLPRSPALRIRVGEARESLEAMAGSWDVVVRDAFAGARVPEHLTTVEFLAHVEAHLAPDGLYLGNLVDTPPLPVARREVATAREVFAHVALAVEPPILKGRRFGNLVVVASQQPLDEARLTRRLLALPAPVRLVVGKELDTFAGTAAPLRDGEPVVAPAPLRDGPPLDGATADGATADGATADGAAVGEPVA
ncbi:spermidine synthase [Serinibacter arcticus]|uniref:spermidine synthase n=1 Tax=Serinibacter arcticus TaxID=1655435 RepID=UPI001F1E1014|nr:fused MFS/spermidine synthase [Serinibacter arcticus]